MIDQFKEYLDKDFNRVARTIAVDDLYEELLGALLDKAEEARKSGMAEEEIFDFCISNFGDYSDALKALDKENKSQKKYVAKKLTTGMLWTVIWFLGMSIIYLTVSFVTKLWNISWVIMVGAAAGYIFALLFLYILMCFRNKWYMAFRFSCIITSVLLDILVYLVFSGITGTWATSWLFVVNIPIIALCIDIGAALFMSRPVYFIEVLLAIFFASVSLFLMTATLFFGYRMTWLFVMAGLFIDLVLIAIRKLKRSKDGREQKLESRK